MVLLTVRPKQQSQNPQSRVRNVYVSRPRNWEDHFAPRPRAKLALDNRGPTLQATGLYQDARLLHTPTQTCTLDFSGLLIALPSLELPLQDKAAMEIVTTCPKRDQLAAIISF